MNKLPVYYPGSSVVVMFRVCDRKNGSCVPLADYSPEAAFYTRLLGRKIRASGSDPSKIAVEPVGEHTLKIVIPPDETEKLPHGPCTVRLTLSHKTDGSRLVVSRKIFNLHEALLYE
ncbi:hypothetical protein LJB87_01460 [Alistipes sp. OttesenSCG-928-L06]|nr:hypothetical protein [Alistipes sp. OttesenSCG-928-L06]